MIAKMTQYSFILLHGDKEEFLSGLQQLGVVDITRSTKPVDAFSQSLLDNIATLRQDIDCTLKGSDPTLVELQGQQDAILKEMADVTPWGEYDRERLAPFGLHYYSVATKKYDPAWEERYAIQVVSQSGGLTWFVVVGDNEGFPLKELPAPRHTPSELRPALESVRDKIAIHREILEARKAEIPKMEQHILNMQADLDRYLAGVAAVPAAEDTIDTLIGFAPSENDAAVSAYLDQHGVFYLKDEAKVEENPPIQFKNNKFVKMFEVLTDMYGRPAYNGFDPTPFIAVFFLLFFALCMGDAGYGLVLILVGLLLKKVDSFKDMAPLVVTLGVATVFVGFFLHTFFSIDIAQWKCFEGIRWIFLPDEIAGYAGGMVLSLVVGVVHLCLAMVVKAINCVKVNGFAASLGTLGWTLLIVGGVIVGAIALTGVLSSEVTKWVLIVLGVVSALGIFVFNDPKRNKLANVGMGLWDTYNTVTGLMGDVLSYLRLYALGLAGAMLGMAFNDMGKMVLGDGSNLFLWIPFILLVLIGHTLNIAMCALGAFVHPLRLNFLEFFKNSGYEAAGRRFNPLTK
ncbi:MAG: V-type ATPase 116kDa subunit family protein [Bacteroidales bacterium]|nr:V-type ATPase 116kDa subunit family protein [Bacteroidales bacterium]